MEAFDKEKHLVTIRRWGAEWGYRNLPDWYFPTNGFIEENVLAGFMYKTDSGVAYLDLFLGNKDATKEERFKAMKDVCAALVEEAKKDKDIKMVLCYPSLESVVEAGKSNGFVQCSPHKFTFMMKMTGNS